MENVRQESHGRLNNVRRSQKTRARKSKKRTVAQNSTGDTDMENKRKNQVAGSGLTRRGFIGAACGTVATLATGCTGVSGRTGYRTSTTSVTRRGAQRLSLERLQQFEALGYGMFISYDIQAFYKGTIHGKVTDEMRHIPPSVYAPDKLDVGQWIAVARDAGMKYAVLTAKRHPGFCLWPSKHTDYSVARSGNTTDVVEQ